MCMVDDAECNDVQTLTMRRARKVWICGECHRSISSGETYEHAASLFDGRWTTDQTCAQCVEARRWLNVVCSGWMFGWVHSDLTEHRHELVATWSLLRLIVGMGRAWTRRDGTLTPVAEVAATADRAIAAYRSHYGQSGRSMTLRLAQARLAELRGVA